MYKNIRTPAIVGFYAPIIILPDINFTDDELIGVLLHELQHHHQRHAIIKCICDIIQTIFWWNPFFRYLNTEVEHTLEMHSDEKVSYYLNAQQQRCYLNAIIKVIKNQEKNQIKSILTCCLVEEAKSDRLEQRFKMLLESNYSKINKQRSKVFIPIMFVFLILSYAFVIQPYSEPDIQNYGTMIDISSNDYLVKTDSGYDFYNEQGELVANISVIDDSLKHLKIINKEVHHEKIIIINLTCVLTAAMFLVILPINIYASDNTTKQALTIENLEISPQSEERGYKYKAIDGKLYKRLWSYTYARWLDKDWILIS